MPKTSGLRQRLLVEGNDLSGDIGSIDTISTSRSSYDVTGIDKDAFERIYGLVDANMEYSCWFNPDPGRAHSVFSALPENNVGALYLMQNRAGAPCFSLDARQVNYDWTRSADGSLSGKVQKVGDKRAGTARGYWMDTVSAGVQTVSSGDMLPDATGIYMGGTGFTLTRTYETGVLGNTEFVIDNLADSLTIPRGVDSADLNRVAVGWRLTLTSPSENWTKSVTFISTLGNSLVFSFGSINAGEVPLDGESVTLTFSPLGPSGDGDVIVHVTRLVGGDITVTIQTGTGVAFASAGAVTISSPGRHYIRMTGIQTSDNIRAAASGAFTSADVTIAFRLDGVGNIH